MVTDVRHQMTRMRYVSTASPRAGTRTRKRVMRGRDLLRRNRAGDHRPLAAALLLAPRPSTALSVAFFERDPIVRRRHGVRRRGPWCCRAG